MLWGLPGFQSLTEVPVERMLHLALDLEDQRRLLARVVQDEAERELYGHLCEALEAWQTPLHPGGAIDTRNLA